MRKEDITNRGHEQESRHRFDILPVAGICLLTAIMIFLGVVVLPGYRTPCLLSLDCRGYEIDSQVLQQMRDQEKDGYQGILEITGWRTEPNALVDSPATGRAAMSMILAVDGSMDMVFSADILSGSYGLATGEDFCVLTSALAYELFGNTEAGGQIRFADRPLTVAGIIDMDQSYMLIPSYKGKIECMVLRFQNRRQMKAYERSGDQRLGR